MRRTEQLQGLRLMKFEEVYGRSYRGELSQVEASEILGVSERTFRRWRDRYQAEGAEGLYDRRLGRARRGAPGSIEVLDVPLFDTRHPSTSPGVILARTCRRTGGSSRRRGAGRTDQAAAPAGGGHDVPGRLQPRVAGEMWDLVVTLDDATRLLGLFRRRGRHYEQFPGAFGGDRQRGRCSLYAGRRTTGTRRRPAARSTAGGRALQQLGRSRPIRRRRGGARSACGLQKRWPQAPQLGRDHHQSRRRPLPRGGLLAGPQRALCPAG